MKVRISLLCRVEPTPNVGWIAEFMIVPLRWSDEALVALYKVERDTFRALDSRYPCGRDARL